MNDFFYLADFIHKCRDCMFILYDNLASTKTNKINLKNIVIFQKDEK